MSRWKLAIIYCSHVFIAARHDVSLYSRAVNRTHQSCPSVFPPFLVFVCLFVFFWQGGEGCGPTGPTVCVSSFASSSFPVEELLLLLFFFYLNPKQNRKGKTSLRQLSSPSWTRPRHLRHSINQYGGPKLPMKQLRLPLQVPQ